MSYTGNHISSQTQIMKVKMMGYVMFYLFLCPIYYYFSYFQWSPGFWSNIYFRFLFLAWQTRGKITRTIFYFLTLRPWQKLLELPSKLKMYPLHCTDYFYQISPNFCLSSYFNCLLIAYVLLCINCVRMESPSFSTMPWHAFLINYFGWAMQA